MSKNIMNFVDDIKSNIEEKVISILGPKGSKRPKRKMIYTERGSFDEDPWLEPVQLLKIFVEGRYVLIKIKDLDGDIEEAYLRDFDLGVIEQVISVL